MFETDKNGITKMFSKKELNNLPKEIKTVFDQLEKEGWNPNIVYSLSPGILEDFRKLLKEER